MGKKDTVAGQHHGCVPVADHGNSNGDGNGSVGTMAMD